MLNEILEFEAYVKSPESEKPRIQPKLLTNNFNEDGNLFGIERILIVIARGYIFSKCHQNEIYNSDGMVNNELLNDTRVILQRWCGLILMNLVYRLTGRVFQIGLKNIQKRTDG